MISSLAPTAPLARLQADHLGSVVTHSQCAHSGTVEKDTEPTLLLDESLRFFPLSPFKTVMAEQNLQSWPKDLTLPLPQVAVFSDDSNFPF